MASNDGNGCLKIDISIGEESLIVDSIQIIKIVRPNWSESNVKHKVFTDGITNKLVGFFEEGGEDIVMVKVYGANTDLMIDRAEEIKTMKILHEKKCGPELYGIFQNGICYEFIAGVTLDVESCRDPAVFPVVAAEMARLHSTIPLLPPPSPALSLMWTKLRKFNLLGHDILATNNQLREKLEASGFTSEWGTNSINELERILESKDIPVTFCHNDLLLGNIIYDAKTAKVSFIDFEYAMPNFPSFDVANHFNEFAGIDGADFSKCPDGEFKSVWIAEYLRHLDIGRSIGQEEFEYWVELCIPASHLFWTLWAVVQAHHSSIDFDFAGYVVLRFVEYERLMKPIREAENTNQ